MPAEPWIYLGPPGGNGGGHDPRSSWHRLTHNQWIFEPAFAEQCIVDAARFVDRDTHRYVERELPDVSLPTRSPMKENWIAGIPVDDRRHIVHPIVARPIVASAATKKTEICI